MACKLISSFETRESFVFPLNPPVVFKGRAVCSIEMNVVSNDEEVNHTSELRVLPLTDSGELDWQCGLQYAACRGQIEAVLAELMKQAGCDEYAVRAEDSFRRWADGLLGLRGRKVELVEFMEQLRSEALEAFGIEPCK